MDTFIITSLAPETAAASKALDYTVFKYVHISQACYFHGRILPGRCQHHTLVQAQKKKKKADLAMHIYLDTHTVTKGLNKPFKTS